MNVIIDYGVGNILSVQRGFKRAGINTVLSNDIETIKNAAVLILPGVGAFKDAMESLRNTKLIPYIDEHVKNNKPLLGICLGMQLLFDQSEEFGIEKGLGYIKGNIVELNIPYKVPHMGWNDVFINKQERIVSKIKDNDFVYFVHSFYAETNRDNVVAYTNYGVDIPAIVQNKNVIGMQFHPEKSGEIGLNLLKAFKEMIS